MKKAAANSRTSKPKRASLVTFPRISEAMKEWSAMLASELNSLPAISTRTMFGFEFFYRTRAVFAALPKTRGFSSATSLLIKFNPMPPTLLKRAQSDTRMDTNTRIPGKGWFTFELSSESDLRDALFWLNNAYESAKR